MNPSKSFSVFVFLALLALGLSACSSGGGGGTNADDVTNSLINGFRLTRIDGNDLENNIMDSTVISYDDVANSIGWTNLDETGAVTYREEIFLDENGRVGRTDIYGDGGTLDYTNTYSFENGLIIRRDRANEQTVNFTYGANGLLTSREFIDLTINEVTRRIEYTSNNAGQYVSATDTFYDYIDGLLDNTSVENLAFTSTSSGQIASVTFGEVPFVSTQEYTYDQNGNLVQREFFGEDGTLLTRSVYSYEATNTPIINLILRQRRFFP